MMKYGNQDIKRVYEAFFGLIVINITVHEYYSSFTLDGDYIRYASCIEEKCEYMFIYEDLLSHKSQYKYPWYKHFSKSKLKKITMQNLIDVYTKYSEIAETLEKQQKTTQLELLSPSSLNKTSDIGYFYESASCDNYTGYFITSTQFTYIEQGMSNYNFYQYKFVKTLYEEKESFMINSINDFDGELSGIDFPKNYIDGCVSFIPLKYKNVFYFS